MASGKAFFGIIGSISQMWQLEEALCLSLDCDPVFSKPLTILTKDTFGPT